MSINFNQNDPDLSEAIASAFADLKAHNAAEEAYQATVNQITKLYKLKTDAEKLALEAASADAKNTLDAEKLALEAASANAKNTLDAEKNTFEAERVALERTQWLHQRELESRPFFKRVDPNVAVTVAGNLVIGIAVIKHERTAVITSKVWSFLTKK